GVQERIAPGGVVEIPLEEAEIERVVEVLRAAAPEAVAIALLWSFENPEHERRLAEAVKRALPDVYLSVSYELDPTIQEYERTSFETALVLEGEPQQVLETEFEGHALRLPMLDIRSIGAGGGSIAWIDEGGALRVGPQSAGAYPGPACYGRGGTAPTVSDANVILGYLAELAGGTLTLDPAAAERALVSTVGQPPGLSVVEAASG